jgi:hypothetical protein
MPWKLSAVLALALVWFAAPVASAADDDEEPEAAAESSGADEDAAASDECPCIRDGWYVGVGGGYAFSNFDDGKSDDSGFANLRAGYHFKRFFALEVMAEYEPKFGSGTGDWNGVDTAMWGASLNGKVYPAAPWTGLIQPYGLVGASWMWRRLTGPAINGSNEDGGFAGQFGGGIDFYVTSHIVFTVDGAYVLPTGALDDNIFVKSGAALIYRF